MNNKSIYALALACVLGSTLAFAENGGEGNNTGCNGQGNPNSPCEGNGGSGGAGGEANQTQGQGQQQGQDQSQTQEVNNENTNQNSSNSDSNSVSGSYSGSLSNSGGNNLGQSVDVSTGAATSSSEATGGTALAVGGDSAARASTGDSEATIGDVMVTSDVGDVTSESGSNSNDISYETTYDAASASASTVFAGYCQTGGSGQLAAGGFSVVNPEAFCNRVRLAAVMREAYQWEMQHGSVVCAEPMSIDWASDQYADSCMNEKAQKYLAAYHENLEDAHDMLEATEQVGTWDAIAGYLIRPAALLALLFLL